MFYASHCSMLIHMYKQVRIQITYHIIRHTITIKHSTYDSRYTSQLKNPNNLDPYRLYNPQQQNNTVIYAFVTNWPDDNLVNLTRVVPTSQVQFVFFGL